MAKDRGREFTDDELDYLRGLPAVERVTPLRIVYTDDFKRACLSRYLMGDSPVRMFREAGLSPELVGYKRIERCFSRWRADAERILGSGQSNTVATWATDTRRLTKMLRGGVSDFASSKGLEPIGSEVGDADSNAADAAEFSDAAGVHVSGPDARDLLIAQLNLRIEDLEHEVARLRAQLGERHD